MLSKTSSWTKNGIFFMIVASLFFSFMGALIKVATSRLPVMEVVFFRALISVVLVSPWMFYQKISFRGNTKMLLTRSFAGFIALSLSVYVTSKLALAEASILNHTSVLFVALFSAIFLREKVSSPLIIYIIGALVGAMLVVKPQISVVNVPGLMGLISGIFAAIAYISIKKLHKSDSFFTMVFYFSLVSMVGSLVFTRDFISPTGDELLVLLGLGVCGTVAQLLMTYSYKYTDASIVSPYSFSSVLFSSSWGALFWNEIPDLWSWLGGILIVSCGIGIMKLKKSRGETPLEVDESWADQSENKA